MVITAAHIPPIVALIAGILILIMPRFLNLDRRDLPDLHRSGRARLVQDVSYLTATGFSRLARSLKVV